MNQPMSFGVFMSHPTFPYHAASSLFLALNNIDDAIITGNRITRNRHDVPILGSFSAARQIR